MTARFADNEEEWENGSDKRNYPPMTPINTDEEETMGREIRMRRLNDLSILIRSVFSSVSIGVIGG